jgi:hypothetical protein
MELVANLLQSNHRESWIVPCKAAALDWQTVRMVMRCRSLGRSISDRDFDAACTDYRKLSQANAGRILRFWQVRQTTGKNAAT